MKLALVSGNTARLNAARRLAGRYGIETETFCGPDVFDDRDGVVRMQNDEFLAFFSDAERLARYDAVLGIDFPETPDGPFPVPVCFLDFEALQIVFMRPEKTRKAYAALQNMFEEGGKLVLQFPEPVSLGQGPISIVRANVDFPGAEKTAPLFNGLELSPAGPGPQEFFYFEMPESIRNVEFQFVNGGYVSYQVALERQTQTFYFYDDEFPLLFALYSLCSKKQSEFYFEKYYLKRCPQRPLSLTIGLPAAAQVALDPLSTQKTHVVNFGERLQPPSEFYTVRNYRLTEEATVLLSGHGETLYEAKKDSYHSCQVVSHPHCWEQCYLKACDVASALLGKETEFLEQKESEFIAGLREAGSIEAGPLLKRMLQTSLAEFLEVNPSGSDFYRGTTQCPAIVSDDVILAAASRLKVGASMTAAERAGLVHCLTSLRCQAFSIPLSACELESVAPQLPALFDMSRRLAEMLGENTPAEVVLQQIGPHYASAPDQGPGVIESPWFDAFFETDHFDVFDATNATAAAFVSHKANQKLHRVSPTPVATVEDLIGLFSTMGIELSSLMTPSGKMLWMGYGPTQVNIRDWAASKGEGVAQFVVLVAGNDEGDEMPALRVWL